MKKTILLGAALVGALLLSGTRVSAVEDSVACGMCENASHGIVNVATGWFEVPMQVHKGYNEGVGFPKAPALDRSAGMVRGIFRGAFHATGRTVWGAFQFVAFWTRNPTENRSLLQLQDSEYSWEQGEKKPLRCPGIDDGINRVARRLERGARNFVGGPAEIPGQIMKADGERRVYVGIPKGLWFTTSRMVYGTADLALLPFAGPEENYNVPFEEVEGWHAVAGKYYNNVK